LIGECIELFFVFPKRNMYHQQLVLLVEAVVEDGEQGGVLRAYVCSQLVPRIMSLIAENVDLLIGLRSCLYGHAMVIARILGPHIDPQTWVPFEKKYVEPYKELLSWHLAGPPPSTRKMQHRPVIEP